MESVGLPSFYVIDHSLRHGGDHHFDLVWSLASAIQARGLNVVIGANARWKHAFPNPAETSTTNRPTPKSEPPAVQVHRVFRDSMYQPFSQLAGLQKMARSFETASGRAPTFWSRLRHQSTDAWRNFRRRRCLESFTERFAQDCQKFFQPYQLSEGDHVCLATVSELELAGLARFLKRNPESIQAQWHLWFHFPLLSGRPPEYQRQTKQLERVREYFISHLRSIPCHRLHFYCTTDSLAEQYNRMGLVKFRSLPYPVNPQLWQSDGSAQRVAATESISSATTPEMPLLSEFHEPHAAEDFIAAVISRLQSTQVINSSHIDQPLRLSSLGAVRREKQQQHYLQPLVDQLWTPWLSTGKLRLQFQQPKKQWFKPAKLRLRVPQGASSAEFDRALQYWPHPIPKDEYRQLLQQTDCGLLLYDSSTYYARRAGIFGELVSLGKPVIVSAGSWLHEQLKDVQFAYHRHLSSTLSTVRHLPLEQLDWRSQNIPLPGGVVAFDQQVHPFELRIPLEPQERGVLLKFLWHCPTTAGIYCQVEGSTIRENGEPLTFLTQVVGHRTGGGESSLFFPVAKHQGQLTLRLTNAFHDSTASITGLSIQTFDDECLQRPLGVVGISVASYDHLAAAVSEWIRHHDHYRITAEAFGGRWRLRNHPEAVVAEMLKTAQQLARAA